jgi:hypothetical protein
MPTATGFLRTRFVDLERTAFDIQAVEFSNGLCRIWMVGNTPTAREKDWPEGKEADYHDNPPKFEDHRWTELWRFRFHYVE